MCKFARYEEVMKKLLTLPPCLVDCFHSVEGVSSEEWYCTCDPAGKRLGSGGGIAYLLKSCHEKCEPNTEFDTWITKEKRILLLAGGHSRRLPGYAPSGKVLTPIPIFRWAKGQRISQNLLQLQTALYERIMDIAPASLHTLIASGDVFIRSGKLQNIPDVDVVCYGMWADPSLISHHGVFVSSMGTPERLDYMLQKPSVETIRQLMPDHLLLIDVGIWLLSDRAVELLMKRSCCKGVVEEYDMYGTFGCALGDNPTLKDNELSHLSVAILPLQDGEFYHFGTNSELISSMLAIQNIVCDQRSILHHGIKPHPSIFVQNAHTEVEFTKDNQNVWVENSYVGKGWNISRNSVITGVPPNDWKIAVPEGVCIDVIPWEEEEYVLRPYGFDDMFRGGLTDSTTTYMGIPITEWLTIHNLHVEDIKGNGDIQSAAIFPVIRDVEVMSNVLLWMLKGEGEGGRIYNNAIKVSAYDITNRANILRLQRQRITFRKENLAMLAKNHRLSVFYQTNLKDMAHEFVKSGVPLPEELDPDVPLLKRISDRMFRSQYLRLSGQSGADEEAEAFSLLRQGLTAGVLLKKQNPHKDVYADQIVWSRSPVRIDLAGGWTDTPPYCLTNGGNVLNLSIELNGQPPLQSYVKCCNEYKIILRSIDLGATEVIKTYDELADVANVGSPFSIPKAALMMAGFHPLFSEVKYSSLENQLKAFGCGIEVTLLSAVPAGSGMGTSSILASTVLGAISDFCGLSWDKTEICNRTLILEQLLTTNGGWQDQYGGVMHGLKLLRTHPGFDQTPVINWLPDTLYTHAEYASCHLLYYTGVTRIAKNILTEIVRNMFLSDTQSLLLLEEMKEHALDLQIAIMHNDFDAFGHLVEKSWKQNKLLDAGTNPPEIESIIQKINDLCLGYKLPGAGGGGFLYMVAKDLKAAAQIRKILTDTPPNDKARFVNMALSKSGMQISRS